MKVALIHDWITGLRGGERCLEAFLGIYPDADIFTLVHVPGSTTAEIDSRVKGTSFLSKLPGVRRYYRTLLPLFPVAVRRFQLKDYDLVISLSHAAAKNVRVSEGTTHVCYCFTPMRYIWDQAPYYFSFFTRVLCAPLFAFLRKWDREGAKRVTHFVAISAFVAARIRLFYGRRARVITPPVRTTGPVDGALSKDEIATLELLPYGFFLCAGALVPYKRIEVAIEAFNRLGLPLVIAGGGAELKRLQRLASPNVIFLGAVRDSLLWECFRRCQALVFPGIEDFGITPVECLASGRPVIGVNAGGLRDFIDDERVWHGSRLVAETPCGVLISKRMYGCPAGVEQAVTAFQAWVTGFSPDRVAEHAQRFSYREFYRAWKHFCDEIGVQPGVESPRFSERGSESATPNAMPARSMAGEVKVVGGISC